VYLNHGYGAKAEVMGKRNLRNIRGYEAVYYILKILEEKGVYNVGDVTEKRALTLSRDRSNGIPKDMRFGGEPES
jgi:hypothetical protein